MVGSSLTSPRPISFLRRLSFSSWERRAERFDGGAFWVIVLAGCLRMVCAAGTALVAFFPVVLRMDFAAGAFRAA
eukprot:1684777-Alexandrium_andersonii.AAC.1